MTELKDAFDGVAKEYDRYRDGYDDCLIADIKTISGLNDKSSVCEVGAGTGQASGSFASSVAKLICVEPSKNLAEILKSNLSSHAGVSVINAPFESAPLEPASFDFVFAAQSFHWVDPEVAYSKVATILKPGGWFAAFWKRAIPAKDKEFSKETKLYQEYLPDFLPMTLEEYESATLKDLAEMVESRLFTRCQLRRYPRSQTEDLRTPRERAESLRTWSQIAALERAVQDELIERLTEVFQETPTTYRTDETTLIIGQKRES